jgi:methyl-accepting chemotaxis protein
MFKSKKSQLTCSYCSRIYKDPILLPCEDSICREHIKERDVVKENKIKCKKCNGEFQIKNNHFESNEDLKKLVESRCYLSEEEISLKKVLEESMRKFFEFYDEFVQNKSILETVVYNHFQEMRFQIDEHSERLRETSADIDDIALKMIDDTKKYGGMFLKNLNESFKENFSSFEKNKSLEDELNEIEELFRDPNLQIEKIKDIQQKQEKSLNEFQSKLNEMKQIKDDLKATNEFQPNSSLFDQEEEETSLFGSLKLNEFCSYMNSLKSQILNNQQQFNELIKICEFSPNDKWSLLYRGTRDGFSGKAFHSKCDNQSNTLTIFKAKESEFIFGGYTTVSWESPARG